MNTYTAKYVIGDDIEIYHNGKLIYTVEYDAYIASLESFNRERHLDDTIAGYAQLHAEYLAKPGHYDSFGAFLDDYRN